MMLPTVERYRNQQTTWPGGHHAHGPRGGRLLRPADRTAAAPGSDRDRLPSQMRWPGRANLELAEWRHLLTRVRDGISRL